MDSHFLCFNSEKYWEFIHFQFLCVGVDTGFPRSKMYIQNTVNVCEIQAFKCLIHYRHLKVYNTMHGNLVAYVQKG